MALSLDTIAAQTQATERLTESRTRAVRSPSLSSDVKSTRSGVTSSVPDVNPPPAFVASAEASQLVSSEADDNILVKDQALSLLNSFLDQILYNILSTAKSVQLGRLRDTVPLVLKPRLGKAALAAADEELKEYLNDGDNELLNGSDTGSELRSDFNLELAWKIARLRCMVYTRLGDMEEEDEEEYIEAEDLHPGSGVYSSIAHRASSVQPASAIFLTSILEYLGEQALLYALQNTQRRAQAPKSPVALQLSENGPMSPPIHQSLVLDEVDMFYVGRESPLSRLWRSWRRQTRPQLETGSRQISPLPDAISAGGSPTSVRQRRIDEYVDQGSIQPTGLPHQIPLPMSTNDVNEIEVPGLARVISDDGDAPITIPIPERSSKRPLSMIISSPSSSDLLSPESSQTTTVQQTRLSRPNLLHSRSLSHPGPEKKEYSSEPAQRNYGVQSAQQPEIGDTHDLLAMPSATNKSAEQQEKPIQNKVDSAKTDETPSAGIVATAASAAAAVTGVGVLAATARPRESTKAEPPIPQPKAARTVADEMIGTQPQVSPPTDAVTGSSITSVDDFDNLHVPVESSRISEPKNFISRPESSDPEDLALSSADEDTEDKSADAPLNNSTSVGIGYPPPLPNGSPAAKTKSPEIISSDQPSHISKSTIPEGTLFEALHEASKEEGPVDGHDVPDRPLYPPIQSSVSNGVNENRQLVGSSAVSPVTNVALNRASASSAYSHPGKDFVRDSVGSRPGSGTATVQSAIPPRVSSDRSRAGHAHTESKSSEYSHHSKSSSSSSKLLGFTRDNEGRPQTGTFHDVVTSAAKPSTSTKSKGHDEASARQSSSTKAPLKLQTGTGVEKGSNDAEAKKKSLEILIRGDETLHYTLTPVSARADNLASPGLPPGRETSSVGSSRHVSVDNPSVRQPTRTTLPPNAINGLRVNPVDKVPKPSIARARNAAYESSRNNPISPSSTTTNKTRTNRVQPRDARLDNTTMLDLADYARSTGPDNEQQLPKALSSRPGTSTTVKTVKSTSNSVSTMPAPPLPSNRPATQQSQGSKSVGARTRFQAREPTVSRRSGTKELIQFLKDGPPPSSPGLNSGNVNGRASAASTQHSSVAPRSAQESMNSSTALLSSNRAQSHNVNGIVANAPPAQRQAPSAQREMMPARKQRRVRDPYAIDDSDEEIEEGSPATTKRGQDESLIDFLRNTAPPPGSSPAPILSGSSSVTASGAIQREPNKPGIRDRILRSTSKSSLNRQPSVSSHRGNYDEPPQYYRSGSNARESSPHLAQTGKKIDSYKPTSVTHAAHVDRIRSEKMSSRPPTAGGRTGTADLADYLRNSGPPERPGGSMQQSSAVKEEAGFLKFFSRRKAVK